MGEGVIPGSNRQHDDSAGLDTNLANIKVAMRGRQAKTMGTSRQIDEASLDAIGQRQPAAQVRDFTEGSEERTDGRK